MSDEGIHGLTRTQAPPEKEWKDPWKHRSKHMLCQTCMFYVEKTGTTTSQPIGRCRANAPTMRGFPAVFPADWCGQHKIDENRV